MIYTELTNKALRFAYNAHHGQLDYNGIPYIFHPIHLAEQMDDEISCCAALLHDVVEDTPVTFEELSREFPQEIVSIVRLLTHEDTAEGNNADYFSYLQPIKANPIAKKVKLADIAHNSDQSRCVGSDLSEERLAYWKDKYTRARDYLLSDGLHP